MGRATLPGINVTALIPNAERKFLGTTDSQWGTAHVLVKVSSRPEHPNVVVNEFICNRLATALGLPTPAGEVWVDKDGVSHWVSIEIRKGGVGLPPPTDSMLRSLPAFDRALIVYFDALVNNIDRTSENVLATSRHRYWLVDHDMALFGDMAGEDLGVRLEGMADRRLPATPGTLGAELLPPDCGDRSRAMWRVKDLNETAIEQAVQPLVWRRILNADDASAVQEYLKVRRDTIEGLVPTIRGPIRWDLQQGMLDWGRGDEDDD